MDLFTKCIAIVKECLNDAKVELSEVDDIVLIGGSSRIPKIQQLLRDLFNGKELCKSINPGEAVAHGAAIQAAKLSGEGNEKLQDFFLCDVTPLSLGVRTQGDIMSVVIPRNTIIPTKMEKNFTTTHDYQSRVLFDVFEGERKRTKGNYFPGDFVLTGISPAQRFVPVLKTCFEIDASGNVSAKDVSTGQKKDISISYDKWRLSEKEIQEKLEDAEKYKTEDEEYKKKIETKQAVVRYACNLRSLVKSFNASSVISPAERRKAEDGINRVITWMDKNFLIAGVDQFLDKKQQLKSIWCSIVDEAWAGDTGTSGGIRVTEAVRVDLG